MAKKTEAGKEQTFEELIERLEEIADTIESGEPGLEKSMALCEEGNKCLKRCRAILKEADSKIEILKRNLNGDLEAEPFEEVEGDTESSAGKRKTGGKRKSVDEDDSDSELF